MKIHGWRGVYKRGVAISEENQRVLGALDLLVTVAHHLLSDIPGIGNEEADVVAGEVAYLVSDMLVEAHPTMRAEWSAD